MKVKVSNLSHCTEDGIQPKNNLIEDLNFHRTRHFKAHLNKSTGYTITGGNLPDKPELEAQPSPYEDSEESERESRKGSRKDSDEEPDGKNVTSNSNTPTGGKGADEKKDASNTVTPKKEEKEESKKKEDPAETENQRATSNKEDAMEGTKFPQN